MFAESADGRVQSTVNEAGPLTSHIPTPAISDGGRGLARRSISSRALPLTRYKLLP